MCETEIKIAYIKKHLYKERKETTHVEVGEKKKKNIHHHIYENKVQCISINGHKTSVQEAVTKKKEKKIHVNLTTSLKIYIHSPYKKCPLLTLPLSARLLSKPKLLPFFCHECQRASHWEVVISSSLEELASSSYISTNIIILISWGLWRRKGRRCKANHASQSAGNATDSGVHLTHLIYEIVETSIHPLKLCHDSIKSHTNFQGRRSRGGKSRRRRWNSRSCRIIHLHSWPFQSKLGLTLLNRTSADGTHDGEKRRERNRNGEVPKDLYDSWRKDELITGSGILIHICNRCDEVRGKVNRKILHQGKKKMSTRLSDGVIMRPWSESEGHHHVQKSRTFCKAQARGV